MSMTALDTRLREYGPVLAELEALRRELDAAPSSSLEEGLRRTAEWFRDRRAGPLGSQ